MKFSSSGGLLWAQQGGSSNPFLSQASATWDLALDSQTNVLACGVVYDTSLFGISVLNTNYSTNAIPQPWLCKFGADGNRIWLKTVPVVVSGFAPNAAAWGLGVDAADAPYMTGLFGGTAHFDATVLTPVGSNNLFFAKYDGAGVPQWVTRDGGTNNDFSSNYDHAGRMAAGATGLAFGGRVPATGSFGSISYTNPPGYVMFVARMDFSPPQLDIRNSSASVRLCWPVVPSGYVLESTTNLTGGSWHEEEVAPDFSTGTNVVSLPSPASQEFFRLHRP